MPNVEPNNTKMKLTAYRDCDDIQLFWRVSDGDKTYKEIPDCLGFAVERQRKTKDGTWGPTETLRNQVGFASQPPDLSEATAAPSWSSRVCPFQRYEWTDHGADGGDTLRYRVIAVQLPPGGTLGETPMVDIATSDWTDEIEVGAYCAGGLSAFFNRGTVMSQYVARQARVHGWKPKDLKENLKGIEEPLRRFLAGELRRGMLAMLDEVISDPELSLYAALYELSDRELIDQLKLLGNRAYLVLANGSDEKGDENATARAELADPAVGVKVYDRILGSKGLGHNKFAVVVRNVDGMPNPLKVWTGSTNWAPTGLCTQLNNGLLMEDEGVARIYFEQWNALADALNDFPKKLVDKNDASPKVSGKVDVWFTRVRKGQNEWGKDIDGLIQIVKDADKVILYVMFQPGPEPLKTILSQAGTKYVRGVVSTVTSDNKENFELAGISTKSQAYSTALVQPEGIRKGFSYWIDEITRSQFLNPYTGIGHAITHAKMIVLDPFDPDRCTVITGSHNFSKSASISNDENFVVIRGNLRLAEAYAVACISTYTHYRWRAYVDDMNRQGKEPWSRLSDKSSWQGGYLTDLRRKHLDVWCPQD